MITHGVEIAPEYAEKQYELSILRVPLVEYYFPKTVFGGPTSHLIAHLAHGRIDIDIRDRGFFQPRLPPFVNMIPLVLILGFIWRRELFHLITDDPRLFNEWLIRSVLYIMLILSLYTLAYSVLVI